jgi:hypothetical protein
MCKAPCRLLNGITEESLNKVTLVQGTRYRYCSRSFGQNRVAHFLWGKKIGLRERGCLDPPPHTHIDYNTCIFLRYNPPDAPFLNLFI